LSFKFILVFSTTRKPVFQSCKAALLKILFYPGVEVSSRNLEYWGAVIIRAGEGVDDIREGLWTFGKCWRRVMEYLQRKKEGLLEIKEHFVHSKKYGFISSFALGIGFATWLAVFQT